MADEAVRSQKQQGLGPAELTRSTVVVIGAGLSGIACAGRLAAAGRDVVVLERSHRIGGRMANRTEQLGAGPHPVDIGAPYFTVRDDGFSSVAQGWRARGLARPWTDTFVVATSQGRMGTTSSPLRWSTDGGMRSLVEDLAHGLDVRLQHEVRSVTVSDGLPAVDGAPVAGVVLAMPDPQADRLLPSDLATALAVSGRAWASVLVVWAAWAERWWEDVDGIFVDGSPAVAWVSDDGRSRGDDAPVLVAHTTSAYAEAMLDDAPAAIGPVLSELPGVLGSGSMPDPRRTRVHRWSLASPRHPHPVSFGLLEAGSGFIGVCGDGWGERSRVEQAWLSGDRLASELLGKLA